MQQNDLNEIIEQLELKASSGQGMFGIYEDRDIEPGCFIKANEQGLVLFIIELLKAAGKFEDKVENEVPPILLQQHDNWLDENSEIVIRYVKPIHANSLVSEVVERKETFADKLVPAGCFLGLIFLVVALITGLVTIGKYVFE